MAELYEFGGLRVASPVALPFRAAAGAPQVAIERSHARRPDTPESPESFAIGADWWFEVSDDRVILGCPSAASDQEIATLLLSGPFQTLLRRRRILPVPGSMVELDGKAIALIGSAGIGVSTLAAELLLRGGRLVSDGFFTFDGARFGGVRRLFLWSDDAARYSSLGQARACRPGSPRMALDPPPADGARPLALTVFVATTTESAPRVAPIEPRTAFELATRHLDARADLAALGLQREMVELCGALARVPAVRVERSRVEFTAGAAADALTGLLAAETA